MGGSSDIQMQERVIAGSKMWEGALPFSSKRVSLQAATWGGSSDIIQHQSVIAGCNMAGSSDTQQQHGVGGSKTSEGAVTFSDSTVSMHATQRGREQ